MMFAFGKVRLFGTFAALIHGADTLANRTAIVKRPNC